MLFLSVVLAVLATLAVRSYLGTLEARAAAGGPGRSVVVAAADLARGTRLTPDLLDTGEVPADFVPPGAIGAPGGALGRALSADVLAGEVITTTRLAPDGGPVASLIPAGLRAFPVTVAVPQGAVAPGDLVDVLATHATGRPYTETVVAGAEVLSSGPAGGEDGFAGAVTLILLVSPEGAERLAFARAFADLAVSVAPPLAEGTT
jgi:pilus assembly protein CpaB